MSATVGFVFLVAIALVIPLILWAAISQETSNPTVVDRAEAERIAKERGGRQSSRSSSPSGDSGSDRREAFGGTAGGRRPRRPATKMGGGTTGASF